MENFFAKRNNKIIDALFTFIFLIIFFFSQVYNSEALFNKEINYQGKLTTPAGVAVADGVYNMEFKLYTVPSGGTAIWTETRTTSDRVNLSNGLFSVMLGGVSSLSGVDFNQTLYLGVNIGGIDVSPDWDGEMTPRKKLGSVPSAFESEKSNKANNLVGGDSATLLGSVPYQSDVDITTLLAPNTTLTKKFFSMTGTGTNGAIPAWETVTATDVGLGNVTNESKATMFTSPTFTGTVAGFTMGGDLVLGSNTITISNKNLISNLNAELLNGENSSYYATASDYIPYTGGISNVDLGVHNFTVDTNSLFVDATNHGVGIGMIYPTAKLHLVAGTTTAGTAPLKFTAGTNLTAAEVGAMEWDGTNLFITQTSGPTRKTIAYIDSSITGSAANISGGAGGQILYQSSGSVTEKLANGIAGQFLMSNGTTLAPSWETISGSSPITIVNTSNLFSTGLTGTGSGVTTVTNSNFFGVDAGNTATAADNSNFFGNSAGDHATEANDSNFLGANAGSGATYASYSNFLGTNAGYATDASFSNFLGYYAGDSATNATYSNFLGNGAGYHATDAIFSNFLGYYAGDSVTDGSYSNLFGYKVGKTFTGNNIGSNNIIIGTNISLPNATSNAINLGGVLFATGTYSTLSGDPSITAISGGKVGIGVVSPTNILSLNGTSAQTIWMERNTTAATAGQGLTLSSGGAIAGTNNLAGGDLNLKSGISTGTGTSAIHFFTATAGASGSADNTPTEKMTILGDGSVGIGTITPGYQLQLSDGTNAYFSVDKTTRSLKIGRSGTLVPAKTLDVAGDMNFNPIVPPTVAGVATFTLLSTPGNIPNGTQWYTIAYYDASGNVAVAQYSQVSVVVSDNTVAGQVRIDNIPISSDPRVVGRKIYRGGQYSEKLLATIANNTTTTYTDNLATTDPNDGVYRRNNYTAGRFYNNSTVFMQVPSSYVTALGYQALNNLTTGYDVVAIGNALVGLTSGTDTIGIGSSAGSQLTTGAGNIAIGYTTLMNNTTGGSNVAVGSTALRRDSGSGANNYNVGIGVAAGRNLAINANYNTFLGYTAGSGALVNGGNGNIFIGGRSTTYTLNGGSYNILLGYGSDAPAASTSNFLNLGQIIYGTGLGTGGSTPSSTAKVGIGNNTPGYLLHVGSSSITDGTVLLRLEDANSTCDFNANTGAPSCGSDITLKKNISDQLDNLDRIMALRPVTYNWLTDQDGVDIKHGFIAQEVENVMPELVTDGTWVDGSTRKFLQTAGMTPYLVGAIKEMDLKIREIGDMEKENSWRDSFIAWFGNATNKITRIFTGEICLTDEAGQTECINRQQLASIKELLDTNNETTTSDTTTTTTTDETTDTTTDTNDTTYNTTTDTTTEESTDTTTGSEITTDPTLDENDNQDIEVIEPDITSYSSMPDTIVTGTN